MYCIGVIGQAGSGKSTAVAIFHRLGVPYLSADKINRALLVPGTTTYERIVAHFGVSILNRDKTIQRAVLRKKITEDASAKAQLEAILHPAIEAEIQRQIHHLEPAFPYCIIEIPLLTHRPLYLHRMLWIQANPTQAIKRIVKRDHCTPEEAKKLIQIQPDNKKYKMIADDILTNEDPQSIFAKKIKTLHHQYLKLAESFF